MKLSQISKALKSRCDELKELPVEASFEDVYIAALQIEMEAEKYRPSDERDKELATSVIKAVSCKLPFLMPATATLIEEITRRPFRRYDTGAEGLVALLEKVPGWDCYPCNCGLAGCQRKILGREGFIEDLTLHRAIHLLERDRLLEAIAAA